MTEAREREREREREGETKRKLHMQILHTIIITLALYNNTLAI